MLLRNLAAQNGDCNGSRYIVKRLGANIVVMTTFDGSRTLIVLRIDSVAALPGVAAGSATIQAPILFPASVSARRRGCGDPRPCRRAAKSYHPFAACENGQWSDVGGASCCAPLISTIASTMK